MSLYRSLPLKVLATILLVGIAAVYASGDVIGTVCGTGQPDNNGDAGKGTQVNVGAPFGVEIGPDGALYVTEVGNHRVLRLDLKTGQMTTVAGCGRKGYSGDGGPATDAELNEPYEVRFDKDGNMSPRSTARRESRSAPMATCTWWTRRTKRFARSTPNPASFARLPAADRTSEAEQATVGQPPTRNWIAPTGSAWEPIVRFTSATH